MTKKESTTQERFIKASCVFQGKLRGSKEGKREEEKAAGKLGRLGDCLNGRKQYAESEVQ